MNSICRGWNRCDDKPNERKRSAKGSMTNNTRIDVCSGQMCTVIHSRRCMWEPPLYSYRDEFNKHVHQHNKKPFLLNVSRMCTNAQNICMRWNCAKREKERDWISSSSSNDSSNKRQRRKEKRKCTHNIKRADANGNNNVRWIGYFSSDRSCIICGIFTYMYASVGAVYATVDAVLCFVVC